MYYSWVQIHAAKAICARIHGQSKRSIAWYASCYRTFHTLPDLRHFGSRSRCAIELSSSGLRKRNVRMERVPARARGELKTSVANHVPGPRMLDCGTTVAGKVDFLRFACSSLTALTLCRQRYCCNPGADGLIMRLSSSNCAQPFEKVSHSSHVSYTSYNYWQTPSLHPPPSELVFQNTAKGALARSVLPCRSFLILYLIRYDVKCFRSTRTSEMGAHSEVLPFPTWRISVESIR